MLKIGQNWGKIANYPHNAQQRSAPLHPNLSIHSILKTFFFLEIEKTIQVVLLICGRFQFFYRKSSNVCGKKSVRKSANVCGKKSIRKSANLNLESAICGLADRFAEVPITAFEHGQRHFETKRSGLRDEHFEMLAFTKGN